MNQAAPVMYQLKVSLRYSKPPIWRRILVASDTTLETLHYVMQIIMEWEDYHLHMFMIDEGRYSIPSPYDPNQLDVLEAEDSGKVALNSVVTTPKQKFTYWYDFGDSWYHDIVLEKILPFDPQQDLPVCIKGKLAPPLEDIGGMWGYYSFLEIIEDPTHPRYEDYVEWVDLETFDPETFDIDAINQQLLQLSQGIKPASLLS